MADRKKCTSCRQTPHPPPPADKPVLTVSRNAHLKLNAVLSRTTSERKYDKSEGVTSYEIRMRFSSLSQPCLQTLLYIFFVGINVP
ncbi:hypothetical protein Barb6XT_01179 [Bacteroidales bacterium Barb6XT]|nr:hypothetical protein Barb6XT_01179 [Bacteroidales bacterium Barb6XT]